MKIKKILSLVISLAMLVSVFAVDVASVSATENDANSDDLTVMENETPQVSLTAKSGDKKVDLAWKTSSLDDSKTYNFKLYKKTSSDEYGTNLLDNTNEYFTPTDGAISGSKEITGLDNLKQYKFNIKVYVNSETNPVASSEATAIPRAEATASIRNLESLHDWKSVTLKWDKFTDSESVDADGYKVFRNNVEVSDISATGEANYKYRVTGLTERVNYSMRVEAYRTVDTERICIAKASCTNIHASDLNTPASALYVTFKAKAKKPFYKTAKGKSKAGYLRKNTTYTAQGFICGRLKYQPNEPNGRTYYFPRVYAKNISMKYTKEFNYTREEAENIVNNRGLTSKTEQLAWVSLYTQHLYFFKRTGNSWKCVNDWETATGVAKSATASGDWVMKNKIRKKRGLSYWSVIYSGVSFHSWGNPKCFGQPRSGGCIRMTKASAYWVYNFTKIGTKVWIY